MNLAENAGARGKTINPVSQCKSNKNWTLTKTQRSLVDTSQVPGEGVPITLHHFGQQTTQQISAQGA
jgi:hypothetical protein